MGNSTSILNMGNSTSILFMGNSPSILNMGNSTSILIMGNSIIQNKGNSTNYINSTCHDRTGVLQQLALNMHIKQCQM